MDVDLDHTHSVIWPPAGIHRMIFSSDVNDEDHKSQHAFVFDQSLFPDVVHVQVHLGENTQIIFLLSQARRV